MFLHRALCRSWSRQLAEPLLPSHRFSKYLRTRTTLIRSMRSSPQHQRPSRSGRLQPAPPFEGYGGAVPPGTVLKALIFTGAFSVGCFMSVTILEYENARSMMLQKARQSKFPWLRRSTVVSQDQNVWQRVKQELQTQWDRLSPGERVFVPLCALNVLVFGLWRVPSLRNTMMKYFCSNPAGRAVCWPMFLSTFSHYSLFHIFANMYVLHSFSNAAVLTLGKEQFLGVYLSAGVFASFASILYKTVTARSGLSIGASGAIMAILAYVCAKYPDTQLSILFLPMFNFPAGTAIKVIMGFDLAGCIMGWKFFDHAAHLGGALFGLFWVYYGTELWQRRMPLLTIYHDLRKTK